MGVVDGERVERGEVLGELLVHQVVDDLGHVVTRVRERGFLDRESVDERIEHGVGVGGHRQREAPAETGDHGVVVPQRRRAG